MPVHDWARVISGIFHDFHQRWIIEVTTKLNDGLLPEGYYALAEQVAEGPEPDVLALEAVNGLSTDSGRDTPSAVSAMALADRPPQVKYIEHDERDIYARKADHVAVYHASGDRVVAFLEIVSPGGKHSQFAINHFLDKLETGKYLHGRLAGSAESMENSHRRNDYRQPDRALMRDS